MTSSWTALGSAAARATALLVLVTAIGMLAATPSHAQITIGGNGSNTTDSTSYSGTQSLTKVGSNQVTLSANSTYSGTTFVNAGTLQVNSSGANFTPNNPNTSYVVGSGATLVGGQGGATTGALWGRPVTVNSGTLYNNVTNWGDFLYSPTLNNGVVDGQGYRLYATGTWQLSGTNEVRAWLATINFNPAENTMLNVANGRTTFTGVITDFSGLGGQSLVKTGTGTLVFTGNNDYSGVTTISAGTLQVGNGGTSGSLGGGGAVNNATLVYSRSDTYSETRSITGSGAVVQAGGATGILVLQGGKGYSGGTVISSGQLNGTQSDSFGTGVITLGDANTGSANTSLLMNNAGSTTVTNNIVVGALGTGTASISDFGTTGLGQHTWTGTLTLNRSVVLNAVDTTYRSDFTGKITGAGGITIGNGRVLISNTANDFTGPVTVNAGTILQLNGDEVLPDASVATINGTLSLATATREKIGRLTGSGGVSAVLSGNKRLTVGDSGTATFEGTVSDGSGTLSLEKQGSGTQILAGNNTYSGSTTISAGTLQIGNGGTSGSLGSGAVVNNATLVFNRSDNTTVSNAISGSGSVVKMGGDVVFNTTNTYSGGLTVLSAIAWVDRASALGSGTITMGGAASAGGQLLVDTAGSTTITNDVVASALAAGNSSVGGFNTGNSSANVWTGTIFLGRDLNLRASNTTTRTTFTGKITGNGGITVTQGRVTLENTANDYLGATTVNAGTVLQLTGNEVLPDATALAVNGSLTLASGGGTETFGRLSGNGSLSALVPGSYTLAIAHTGTATFDGTISNNAGSVALVKNGSGTQVLTGANTYTGPTTINGGRLVVANTTASTTYTNNATLEFSAAGTDIKLAGGTLSGSGTIVKTGTNGLWLGGNGATQAISLAAGAVIDVQQGYLRNEYGAGDWSANQGSLNVAAGATVDLWDSPGGIRVNSLTGAGSVTNGIGANSNLTVGVANGSGAFGGVISNGVGTVGLVKQGNGTQVLSGNNTYTGATTVSAGKLVINGDQSAATGVVTVAAGAALGGSGTVGGATTIAGSHTPGNSPGVQTFASDLTYQGGSSVQWELAANSVSNSPVVFDQILVGGNLTFSGSTALSLAFNGAGSLVDWRDTAFWGTDRSWLIYDVTGTTTGLANLLLLTENWADASGDLFAQYLPNASFKLEQQGSDVYLTFQAVPEPSTVVLIGIGLAGLALVRRRC